MAAEQLRIPAIEVRQSAGRVLYSFAVDGKTVPLFAAVSRVHRDDGELEGYQRPEVLSHIAEIRNYLEGESPMIPNAVVIAFDKRVRFEPLPSQSSDFPYSRQGHLVVDTDLGASDAEKPGFVVDGQQRLAAIRDAAIASFPICVTGFIAHDVRDQVEQFILVNSTKPLPKGLIYELLPTTQTTLPSLLHRRRFPAYLLDRLNRDHDSPFCGLIQTPTTPTGVIKDNSVLKMLENSISDGILYRFRNPQASGGDVESMLTIVKAYWAAAKEVFPDNWGKSPRHSRLMHGAGIVSMGFLMDAIADRHRSVRALAKHVFRADLEPMRDHCHWADGFWNFGPGRERKWSDVQNTQKDIQILSNHLILLYRSLVCSVAPVGAQSSGAFLPLESDNTPLGGN